MLVAEDECMCFADGEEGDGAADLTDVNEVTNSREVFVEEASAVALGEAWSCSCDVELL